MADIVDEANRHVQMHLDNAISAATKPRCPGLPECEECAEPISEFRQLLGARRCVDCQTAYEHTQRHHR